MKPLACAAFFLGCYLLAGTLDFNDRAAAAAESRQRAASLREAAPVWSKKCERQGMDVLAKKTDNGPWKIHCIPRRTLKV